MTTWLRLGMAEDQKLRGPRGTKHGQGADDLCATRLGRREGMAPCGTGGKNGKIAAPALEQAEHLRSTVMTGDRHVTEMLRHCGAADRILSEFAVDVQGDRCLGLNGG